MQFVLRRSLTTESNVLQHFSNPQNTMSCMNCAVFRRPRVPVSCCKTLSRSVVTAETRA